MNEITLLRDGGPQPTPLSPAALHTARAALLAEIETASAGVPEPASVLAARQLVEDALDRRRDFVIRRRRVVLRMSAAALAVAAAVTAAVLVAGPDGRTPPSRQSSQAQGLALVDFALPAFPFTLATPPPGAGAPRFGADASGGTSLGYVSTTGPLENVIISVGTEPPPPGGSFSAPGAAPEQVSVDGVPAVLVVASDAGAPAIASLDWQRRPGQWVTIHAQGRYAERDLLLGMATGLVDRPQPLPVQLHLAPEGYRLDVSKDDGRVVILADDADPEKSLVVRLLADGETDGLQAYADVAGRPVDAVVVQGQPARLARTDLAGGGLRGWVLQASLPDGSAFVVEAPGDLTREQVVQVADQVTSTP